MAEIIARNGNELAIQVTVKLTGSLLDMENTILRCKQLKYEPDAVEELIREMEKLTPKIA